MMERGIVIQQPKLTFSGEALGTGDLSVISLLQILEQCDHTDYDICFVQIGENDVKTAKDDPLCLNNHNLMHALINIVEEVHRQGVRRVVFVPLFHRHHSVYNKRCNRLNKLPRNMPDANIMSHSDHMTGTLFEIGKIVWRMSNNVIIVALHYLLLKTKS